LRDFTPPDLSLFMEVILASSTPITEECIKIWIVYQSFISLSITSHIHPKRTYQPKLSCVFYLCSEFTVFPVASLLSVKGSLCISTGQETILGSKFLQHWSFNYLPCRLRVSLYYNAPSKLLTRLFSPHCMGQITGIHPLTKGSKKIYPEGGLYCPNLRFHPHVAVAMQHGWILCIAKRPQVAWNDQWLKGHIRQESATHWWPVKARLYSQNSPNG